MPKKKPLQSKPKWIPTSQRSRTCVAVCESLNVKTKAASAGADSGADGHVEDLEKDYGNYFPNLRFSNSVFTWILDCDKGVRRVLEAKFRIMNQERLDGKHECPGTSPLVWQHDAGHGLRIYFRQEHDHRASVLMLGTKGTQDSDYSKLKKI